MARSTKPEKSERLNAAYRLLRRPIDPADAARRLARDFDLSLRQAYRYLEEAQTFDQPVPVSEPLEPMTFKLPADAIRRLRQYSAARGMTLSEIVTLALKTFLARTRRHG